MLVDVITTAAAADGPENHTIRVTYRGDIKALDGYF